MTRPTHEEIIDALYRVLEQQEWATTSDVMAELGCPGVEGRTRMWVLDELHEAAYRGCVTMAVDRSGTKPRMAWGEA